MEMYWHNSSQFTVLVHSYFAKQSNYELRTKNYKTPLVLGK